MVQKTAIDASVSRLEFTYSLREGARARVEVAVPAGTFLPCRSNGDGYHMAAVWIGDGVAVQGRVGTALEGETPWACDRLFVLHLTECKVVEMPLGQRAERSTLAVWRSKGNEGDDA